MNFQKLYVDPDEGYRFQKEMKEKDSVQDFETKLRRKDDVEMDCIFDVVCRQGDDGKILKYQGIIRDISEAKRAQEALRTSQQRLSQIINFLPDATFVIDNEGKVVTWNHAMERMTGVKAEEILGKGNHEYAVPFYGERRPTLIDLASKWNKATAGKYQYVKRKGNHWFPKPMIPGLNLAAFYATRHLYFMIALVKSWGPSNQFVILLTGRLQRGRCKRVRTNIVFWLRMLMMPFSLRKMA